MTMMMTMMGHSPSILSWRGLIFLGMVVLALPQASQGERHIIQVDNMPPSAFFVASFGYDGEGKLGLRMSNITINGQIPDSDSQKPIGFVIKRSNSDARDFLVRSEITCPLRFDLNAFEMRHLLPPK